MPNPNDYRHGDWNAICDRCGHKFKASQLRPEWTGLRVCSGSGTNDCWEARHPQLSVKAVPDKQSVPWSRPEADDVVVGDINANYWDIETGSVTGTYCTAETRRPIADGGTAGCAEVGFSPVLADEEPTFSSTFNITDTIGS